MHKKLSETLVFAIKNANKVFANRHELTEQGRSNLIKAMCNGTEKVAFVKFKLVKEIAVVVWVETVSVDTFTNEELLDELEIKEDDTNE